MCSQRPDQAWRIAPAAAAILSGSVTGSEQISPTQTKAAGPSAAFSFSCAGCDGLLDKLRNTKSNAEFFESMNT